MCVRSVYNVASSGTPHERSMTHVDCITKCSVYIVGTTSGRLFLTFSLVVYTVTDIPGLIPP